MDYPIKTCSRCNAPLQQWDGAFELARKGAANPEHSSGPSVSVYCCPKCGYIELYSLRVTSSI